MLKGGAKNEYVGRKCEKKITDFNCF